MFLDDFTEFTTNLLSQHTNNIILSDFNLHISKDLDTDAAIFIDTCEAMGLYQHISFATHKSGNILDLMLTEVCSSITILQSHHGPFISDHAAVIAQLNIKRQTQGTSTQVICKLKDITQEQWIEAFTDKDLQLSGDLNDLTCNFDSVLKSVLDELAPEKSVKVPLKPKQPWYTSR